LRSLWRGIRACTVRPCLWRSLWGVAVHYLVSAIFVGDLPFLLQSE
jgi:hypothetical protein